MSRNQSINKIAPHINSSLSAVQGVNKTSVPPFSPYAAQARDNESNQERQDTSPQVETAEKSGSEKKQPEIFTLIANPDFSELFVLVPGKGDSTLLFTIKKMRRRRGVTSLIPLSDNHQESRLLTEKYHNMEQRIITSKGQTFAGSM